MPNFIPSQEEYKKNPTFKLWVANNFPFIEEDFDATTNYQLMCKIVAHLNTNIENMNTVESNVSALHQAFTSLNNYVNNYFDNLDVQQEVNTKLDIMAHDGSLTRLIKGYVDPFIEEQNEDIEEFETTVRTQINDFDSRLRAVASGSPKGVYARIEDLRNANPETGVYIVSANGHIYAWTKDQSDNPVDLGVYQASEDSDTVNLLKNILNYKELTYTTGAYIPISAGVIDVNNPTSAPAYKYSITECNEGDIFTINGKGGQTPRLWCFTDENYNALHYAGANEQALNTLIIAPANSKYLIVNDNDNKISFKNENVNDRLTKNSLIEEIDVLSNQFTNNIISSTNVVVTGSGYISTVIPIDRKKYNKLKLKANQNQYCRYGFLKSPLVVGQNADYATGYTETKQISAGESIFLDIPNDTNYVYILGGHTSVGNRMFVPEEFILSRIDEFIERKSQKNERYIIIAASNSSSSDKNIADYVCTGTNDEAIFNQVIARLQYGGTIQLMDGDYYIDEFNKRDNSAIYFGGGTARTITIKGTTENKSYASRYGVTIHVTETAINSMNDTDTYNLFYGTSNRITVGNSSCYQNNVNFENFYVFIHGVTKKVVGINALYFGGTEIKQVGIYSHMYFHDRFNHVKPDTPVDGLIGVITPSGSNDEMAKISFNCLNVGGLHTGIKTMGVDHLIMNTCTTARCCIGYHFAHTSLKTLTMINCCDEGNTRLPVFDGTGQLTCIDFNIERFDSDYIPDDPSGDVEHLSVESTEGGWKGFISYTLQGNAFGINKLWKNGSGQNFKTINLYHNLRGTVKPSNPQYLEQFFNTTTNKTLTYNGTNWVDAMGNVQ